MNDRKKGNTYIQMVNNILERPTNKLEVLYRLDVNFNIEESNVDKFLEVVYQQTNIYEGNLWNVIEPKLSAFRTHTAISVGDEIEIDGQVYICADFGFDKIEDVEIKYHGDSVFRVYKKVGV